MGTLEPRRAEKKPRQSSRRNGPGTHRQAPRMHPVYETTAQFLEGFLVEHDDRPPAGLVDGSCRFGRSARRDPGVRRETSCRLQEIAPEKRLRDIVDGNEEVT